MAIEETQLQDAVARAERAEAQVAELQANQQKDDTGASASTATSAPAGDGETELRKDEMMAHLFDALHDGKDIGHYGRLVFAMVARPFLPAEEVVSWLTRDRDFSESQATAMLAQVEARAYNPPRRERIVEWQAQQEFPILPHPDDPDCGNVYRNLKFPDAIYNHIEQYQEQKGSSG